MKDHTIEINFTGCKISIYKNPRSGKFRWQISSVGEFETSNEAAESIDRILNLPRDKAKSWIWDTLMKRWKCPYCGRYYLKSTPHCQDCGHKLEKGE